MSEENGALSDEERKSAERAYARNSRRVYLHGESQKIGELFGDNPGVESMSPTEIATRAAFMMAKTLESVWEEGEDRTDIISGGDPPEANKQ